MIEEPYRWVEAVANRREYIEMQLAAGRAIAAVGCVEGILFVTVGGARQKVFEIYDRIAMGAIGHPGDIERLRMAAIELASTEGFTRSAADVSLRRLAYYSLSPVLKTAFEQVYGAPYLARLLFAELGEKPSSDLFLRVDYDGAIEASGGATTMAQQQYGVLSATRASAERMAAFLQSEHDPMAPLPQALAVAVDAWSIGDSALRDAEAAEPPPSDVLMSERAKHLASGGIEAAFLERHSRSAIRYRLLEAEEIARAVTP